MSGGALGRKVLRHSPRLFPLPPCLSLDGVLDFACRASSSTSSAAVQRGNESKSPGNEQVLVLRASPRDQSGSRAAAVLRKNGRVPGILFSMPNDEKGKLVSFDEKEITSCVQKLGRTAWGCTVFAVQIEEAEAGTEIRAVGRQVHMTASSGAVENVTLLHCPSDRRVKLQVPLKVFGFEICPGLKAGGRINWITRTIACTAMGSSIPNAFEVNIGHLEINDKLSYGDLTLPEGVVLSVKDLSLPILKIMRK